MKFVDGDTENNNQGENTPLFRNDSEVDLLKTESGFEGVKGDNKPVETVEPKAEVITNADQLDAKSFKEIFEDTPQTSTEMTEAEKLNSVVEKSIDKIQATPTIEPVVISNEKFPEVLESKKKGKTGLFILVILILLVAAGCIYYFVFLTPEKIIKNGLSSLYTYVDKLEGEMDEELDFTTLKNTGNFKIDTTIEEYASLKGYNVNYNIGYDLINEKVNTNLTLLNGSGDELVSALYYLKDNVSYLNLKDITPKIIKIDLTEYTEDLFTISEKEDVDYSYLVEVIGNAFYNAMSKNKLSRTITYDEAYSNAIAVKVIYSVDSDEYKKITEAVVNAVKDDSKALEIVSKELGYSIEETKELLDEELDSTDYDIPDTKITAYINPLTNEPIRFDIKNSDIKFNYTYDGKNYNISLFEYGDNSNSTEVVYNEADNTVKVNYTSIEEGVTSNIELNMKGKVVSEKKSEITVEMKYKPDNTESNSYLSFTLSNTAEQDATIEEVDVSGAVAMEELTMEQLESMLNSIYGLMEALGVDITEL